MSKIIDQNKIDQIVDRVVTISFLPVGPNQIKIALDEPIEILKYKTISLKDSLKRPGHDFMMSGRKLSEKEVQTIVKSGTFITDMVPQSDRFCRDCNKTLPTDRHWHCQVCLPVISGDDQFVYMGSI